MFDIEELKKQYKKFQVTTINFPIKRSEDGSISEICLAMKKRGMGEGLWNGSGGKVGDKEEFKNETVEEGAKRELEEEICITALRLTNVGEIMFDTPKKDWGIISYVFLIEEWDGEPRETEEMKPKWFKVDNIPFEKMWESDHEWLIPVLEGHRVKGNYQYIDNFENKKVNSNVEVLD